MLDDIQSGKVHTDYVLVFKLSRFGRNARDVLNFLEFITGRVAWGKRRTEKVPGKDNEYRLVKQDEYILSEVISHEAFVSKEDFDKVQEIKAIRGKKGNHNIGQYNAHLLSGIVKCPQCGAPMYIGMTKWTNQDGTERRTESYVCSYATKHRGTSVCRRNGVVASQVEDEVMEYTRKIVRNPQFIKDLQEKVMTAVDMSEVENDMTSMTRFIRRRICCKRA